MGTKRFVTLFLDATNVELMKDVGQIPFVLSSKSNIEGVLVSKNIKLDGSFIGDVEGLKIEVVNPIFNNNTLTGVFYLLKNAREIDILNLYHCRRNNYIFSKLYKLLNKNGKVYLKLDAGYKTIDDINNDEKYKKLFVAITNYVDFVSTESRVACSILSSISGKEIACIPNGTTTEKYESGIVRNNTFITVGRIGALEKNNELLLEAFAMIADLCDWKIEFVGNCEDSFMSFYKELLLKHPELKDRIILTGAVYDREKLFALYRQAKVFVLPSKFENFSLACVEAIMNGCYLVLSDKVTPSQDFTNNLKYGQVCKVDDARDLADKMLEAIKTSVANDLSEEIAMFGRDNFSWDVICEKLCNELGLLQIERK